MTTHTGRTDCYGCAGIIAYWWATRIGNIVGLCERCCALWRMNARDDPDLMPLSIVSIGEGE